MNEWLISIAVVSVFTFLIKILLPNNKTRKLITFILSATCVLVIMWPIGNYKSSDIELSQFEFYDFDKKYIEFVNECRQDYYLLLTKNELQKSGITVNWAEFIFDGDDENGKLKKIIIKKDDLVIIENCEHINISYKISSTLAKLFSINNEDVVIYE